MFPDLIWVWEIFNYLNRFRQTGANGPQPLILTDIKSICDMKNIVREADRELLLDALAEMDAVYLKDFYDQVEKANRKSSKTNKKMLGNVRK